MSTQLTRAYIIIRVMHHIGGADNVSSLQSCKHIEMVLVIAMLWICCWVFFFLIFFLKVVVIKLSFFMLCLFSLCKTSSGFLMIYEHGCAYEEVLHFIKGWENS